MRAPFLTTSVGTCKVISNPLSSLKLSYWTITLILFTNDSSHLLFRFWSKIKSHTRQLLTTSILTVKTFTALLSQSRCRLLFSIQLLPVVYQILNFQITNLNSRSRNPNFPHLIFTFVLLTAPPALLILLCFVSCLQERDIYLLQTATIMVPS